jgi:hypothetical protein
MTPTAAARCPRTLPASSKTAPCGRHVCIVVAVIRVYFWTCFEQCYFSHIFTLRFHFISQFWIIIFSCDMRSFSCPDAPVLPSQKPAISSKRTCSARTGRQRTTASRRSWWPGRASTVSPTRTSPPWIPLPHPPPSPPCWRQLS